jgi:hypothetical protein
VIRAGLHLLEEHVANLAALRAAPIEGAPSEPVDFDYFVE